MSLMDLLSVISLIVGIISILFAFFVWRASISFESRVKETLSEIDKNAALIKQSVESNQEKLMATVTDLVLQAAKNNDPEKQAQIQLISTIFQDPKKLSSIIELMNKFPNSKNHN